MFDEMNKMEISLVVLHVKRALLDVIFKIFFSKERSRNNLKFTDVLKKKKMSTTGFSNKPDKYQIVP